MSDVIGHHQAPYKLKAELEDWIITRMLSVQKFQHKG